MGVHRAPVFKALLSSSLVLMIERRFQYSNQTMKEGPFSKIKGGYRVPTVGLLSFSPLRTPLSSRRSFPQRKQNGPSLPPEV